MDFGFVCTKCGAREDSHTIKPHCECKGLWRLDYEPPAFDLGMVDRKEWSIFRYRSFMPLSDDSWKKISLGEGMTPIVKFSKNVLLKMDYFMPTLSFKDRGAAVLMAECLSAGIESVVQDSSGNAGNSVAAYAGRAGIACEIFVPEGTSPKKIDMIKAHGARVNVVPGSRDNCADVCRSKVASSGIFYANHVYNPFFYEGTKTYIYEVFEQLHRIPQHIFIPLGNGTLFIGVTKALEHLIRSGVIDVMPKVFAVQSEHCKPFAEAASKGAVITGETVIEPTLAEGIAIGKPMRAGEILEMIYRHNIKVITAPEDKILSARAELAQGGIYCEHTTAATYAAYKEYCRINGELEDTLLPMCGAGLKSDH